MNARKDERNVKKKIAVITARADDRTQKDIICGIAEAAFAADTDVVVFSNIYNHRIRDEFLNFENVIYDFLIRAALTELLSLRKRFWTFPPQNLAKRSARFQAVEKPLVNIKNGCRLLLALLVLHRAKLLASNQSILALGRSPHTGRQPFVPLHRAVALCG